MTYTCKGDNCGIQVEAPDFKTIVSREKLCESCFSKKYGEDEQAITLVTRHGLSSTYRKGKIKSGMLYRYVCYSCGWVSKLHRGRPLTCKSCRQIPLYMVEKISDTDSIPSIS